jgi:SAM-dependent methyltransferase
VKPQTTEDIYELLDGYITSSALGTAMELGLFWLLAESPLAEQEIARSLDMPLNRCHNWLQILSKLGLIEAAFDGVRPSAIARQTILDAHSRDTWAFLAREDRDRFSAVRDLAVNICKPISTWEAQALKPPDYFRQILEEPGYAARVTRMLYEIHLPLAEQVAGMLDLRGVGRLLDLGGGSGVISLALLRKQPGLTSVVVDVANVCQTGREIALENELGDRITYLPANFIQDDLPAGFDLVMFCDGGPLDEALFRRIHAALNPGGRLVIVNQLAPRENQAAGSHFLWAFLSSLEYPQETIQFTTTEMVRARLERAGFRECSTAAVPYTDPLRWNLDWTMLIAKK